MSSPSPTRPPQPAKRPRLRALHGERVEDPWAWLADREAPEVLAHLEAENAYTDACLAESEALQETLYRELRSRVQETDRSVPARQGRYWYYQRTVEGLDYAIYCRAEGGPDGPETVLLDANAEADGHEYFDLGTCVTSADGRFLAVSIDTEGDELYRLRFRDLETGRELPETIEDVTAGGVFSADGQHFLYVAPDDAMRPYQLVSHRLGTELEEDELLFQEDDEHFSLDIDRSRDDRLLIVTLESLTTTEQWLLPADEPGAEPRCVQPRRNGVQYWVEPWRAGRGVAASAEAADTTLVMLTTEDAPDGRVIELSLDDFAQLRELLPADPGRKIEDLETFPGTIALVLRREGRPRIALFRDGKLEELPLPDRVASVELGEHLEFSTEGVRIELESLSVPHTVFEKPLDGGPIVRLKREAVPGGYDPALLECEELWASSPDGTRVPISLVRHRDVTPDGSGALLLYAYGAYETCSDPWFSPGRLSLLDRGIGYAIAHVRGGGELGRAWYEGGKLANKRNSVTDLLACADALEAAGYCAPDRLALRVESAGGLLAGAALNERPDRFCAVLAEVPFVDLVNTLLDASLPLTVGEWEEWGNPEVAEQYAWLRAYAPYERVREAAYPPMLVTAGLHDPRVGFWEPAKWVARLREANTADSEILLRTELEAGHGGPSGRTAAWREEALALAFLLRHLAPG